MVLKAYTLTHKNVSHRILILRVLKIFDVNFYVLFVHCGLILSLNLTISLSRFHIRWHAWRTSGIVSWPVKALQIASSRKLWISWSTGFSSTVCLLWYSTLLTVFSSNWAMWEYSWELHFLVTTKSDWSSSYFFENCGTYLSVIWDDLQYQRMFFYVLCSTEILTLTSKIIKELRAKNNFKHASGREQCWLSGDYKV